MTEEQLVRLLMSAGVKQEPPRPCGGDDLQIGDVFRNERGNLVAFNEILGDEPGGRVVLSVYGDARPNAAGDPEASTTMREPIPVLYRLRRRIDSWVLQAILDDADAALECVLFRNACWRCKTSGLAFGVVGFCGSLCVVDASLLVEYPAIGSAVKSRLRTIPGGLQIGAVKRRFSRTVGEAYMSQGCPKCDALWGDFPLGEAFRDVTLDLVQSGKRTNIAAMWDLDPRTLLA